MFQCGDFFDQGQGQGEHEQHIWHERVESVEVAIREEYNINQLGHRNEVGNVGEHQEEIEAHLEHNHVVLP